MRTPDSDDPGTGDAGVLAGGFGAAELDETDAERFGAGWSDTAEVDDVAHGGSVGDDGTAEPVDDDLDLPEDEHAGGAATSGPVDGDAGTADLDGDGVVEIAELRESLTTMFDVDGPAGQAGGEPAAQDGPLDV